ncbi:MAG: metallophosphoesterase family protein [Clostridiales bacterium]|jgi:putative phosphoesterase|nr:metallophosphoesterase family protein [Clostridiales bacterium]
MRLAVLSDIHSNKVALSACIKDIKESSVDGICLLGDYISDCPNPQATISLLKELMKNYRTWIIKGNREQYLISHDDGIEDGWKYTSYKGSLLYTYESLTKEDIDYLRGLPIKCTINIEGTEPILLVHGSQRNIKELLYEDTINARECMDLVDEKYILCGHTHKQTYFKYKEKVLINPGSVGIAIGQKARAQYCIIEWKEAKWVPEFKNIPYNLEEFRSMFYNSSLMAKGGIWPKCIIKSVEEGINWGPLCSKRAYDYAIEDGLEPKFKSVPDKYWQIAAKDLGIL